VRQFVRKSVEGLSIALFVCAFLGNTFYVGSILTSPPMSGAPAEVLAFLMESLPCVSSRAAGPPVRSLTRTRRYLLGSGGTLMFDVTIVCQSLLYRKRAPLRPRGRRAPAARALDEEEAGLLDAEAGS
jgi:hypothetical protein